MVAREKERVRMSLRNSYFVSLRKMREVRAAVGAAWVMAAVDMGFSVVGRFWRTD
jgi:hypothetical protein